MENIRLGTVQLTELEDVLLQFINHYVYGFKRWDALARAKLARFRLQGAVLILSLCGLEVRADIESGWVQISDETWEITMELNIAEDGVAAAIFRKPAINREMAGRDFPRLILTSTHEAMFVELLED